MKRILFILFLLSTAGCNPAFMSGFVQGLNEGQVRQSQDTYLTLQQQQLNVQRQMLLEQQMMRDQLWQQQQRELIYRHYGF